MAEPGAISLGLKQGSFQGSDAIVKALSEVGQVVRRSSLPVLSLNRRPVTHAVRTTFSYIDKVQTTARSEEHTSELQSLMRLSYAVFCLKKKKTQLYIPQPTYYTTVMQSDLTTNLNTTQTN